MQVRKLNGLHKTQTLIMGAETHILEGLKI